MRLRLGFVVVCLWSGVPLAAEDLSAATIVELRQALDAALADDPKRPSVVAAIVLDGVTGRTLYATDNADAALVPASNLKLLTSAAALDRLGPDAELRTQLLTVGDDLVVVGFGDPAFGDRALNEAAGRTPMSVFDDWAAALRAEGIDRVAGDVVVIDAVFDDRFTHPSWGDTNRRRWYGAPVAGVNFNTNNVDFTFTPTTPGRPAAVTTVPPRANFVVTGTVTTAGEDGKHGPVLDKRLEPVHGNTVYPVRGTLQRVTGVFSKPVDDPRAFFGHTLRHAMIDRGIAVAGGVRVETHAGLLASPDVTPIVTHTTPLTDVLARVNRDSQNTMAEALAKLNGYLHDRAAGDANARGSWASGHAAAVAFLQSLGIDNSPVVSADGSGLSRNNRLSARVLAELLHHMLAEHEYGQTYVASLAVSGTSGSLRRRLGGDLAGRVWAKTGTINGVSSLSGYVYLDARGVAVFSILHNGRNGRPSFRQRQDAAVAAIAGWLDTQPAKTPDRVTPAAP
ncbi:MAG: D-alanyl-D-alanine carboxypeptidase/D-alanyl-D-alanine-endopeptidase [Planctomycetota bacterium]